MAAITRMEELHDFDDGSQVVPFVEEGKKSFAMEMWKKKGGRYWEFCGHVLDFTLASRVSFQDDTLQQQFSYIYIYLFGPAF